MTGGERWGQEEGGSKESLKVECTSGEVVLTELSSFRRPCKKRGRRDKVRDSRGRQLRSMRGREDEGTAGTEKEIFNGCFGYD